MRDSIKELLVIVAVWFLALGLAPVMYIVTGDIHESGHALACIARGGNVKGLQGWLHDILPFHNPPFTDCSLRPLPALVWAAGALASIAAWSAGALIVGLLLNGATAPRSYPGRFRWLLLGLIWSWWCLFLMMELFNETRHAYAPPKLWEDSTQFVHITGVSSNVVGLPLAAMFVITIVVLVLFGRRFVNIVTG